MTVKDYFYQAFTIDKMLRATRSQLAQLKEQRLCIPGIAYDKDKVQTSPNRENFNALSDLYMDLERKYIEDEIRLTRLKVELKGYIDSLKNPTHRLIMTERYINLKTWPQIALDNDYEHERTLHKIHGRALNYLNRALKGSID